MVRAATPGDIGLLAGIEVAAGERFREIGMDGVADDSPPPLALYAEAQRRGHLWVATVDETVVGYAWAVDLEGQPHLEQISVVPELGGHGIGVALVDRVAVWATEVGGTSLTLSTFRDVPWNAPWYERLGFVAVERPDDEPRWRGVRRHEAEAGLDVDARVIMRLVLPAPAAPAEADSGPDPR